MSRAAFEASQLTVACAGCAQKTRKSVAWFRNRDHVMCPGCGERVDFDIENLISELRRKSSEKSASRKVRPAAQAREPARAVRSGKLGLGKLGLGKLLGLR